MNNEIKKCINCKYSRQCVTMKQVNPECCLKDRENEKKDEIKEILDKLLDYITNLQQIEKEHQKINGELRVEVKKLQEENKALKDVATEHYRNRRRIF